VFSGLIVTAQWGVIVPVNPPQVQRLPEAPKCVLILNDQPLVAEAMAMFLRAGGYVTQSFTSAHEALEKIGDFDILITDYHLPEMTGMEVAKKAHAQGWRGSLLLRSGHR
jgi:CheY-like chemotaxis protein